MGPCPLSLSLSFCIKGRNPFHARIVLYARPSSLPPFRPNQMRNPACPKKREGRERKKSPQVSWQSHSTGMGYKLSPRLRDSLKWQIHLSSQPCAPTCPSLSLSSFPASPKKGLCRGSMDKLYGRGSRAFTLRRRKIGLDMGSNFSVNSG